MDRLKCYRDEELEQIRKLMILGCWSILLNVAVPAFSAVIGFVLYSWEGKPMEAAVVFPVLTYFNMLDLPLSNIPIMAASSVDAFAAMKRLQEFLRKPDGKGTAAADPATTEAIHIKNGSFGWNVQPQEAHVCEHLEELGADQVEEIDHMKAERLISVSPSTEYDVAEHTWCPEPISEAEISFQGLNNINLRVPKGSLIAVVGPVGSGKSSLLAAIFGEMEQHTGSLVLGGSIGYCPQQPWLLNANVRQNILVSKTFNEERYWRTIKECEMEEDLVALPYGDMTDIGEGGISLSGGQKARLNLARMVYFNRDIVLMDDPLSAVDNRVGKAIFENCILSGYLAGKTRILVTHHLGVLPRCDHIIVMRNGLISEQGNFTELMQRSNTFADLLTRYGESHRAHPEAEEQHQIIDELDVDPTVERHPTPVCDMTPTEEALKNQTNWRKEELQAKSVSSRAYVVYMASAGGTGFLVLVILSTIFNEIAHSGRDIWVNWWVTLHDGFGLELGHTGFRNMFIAIAALQTLLTWFCGYIFIQGGYRASKYLHDAALQRLLKSPVRFFDTTPVGRIINRFGRDLDMVDDQVADSLWYLSYSFGSMIATLMVMLVWIPSAALVFLLPVSLAVMLQALYRAGARQLQRLQSTFFSPLMSNFSETYLGLSIIRAFNLGEHFRAKHYAATNVVSQVLFATFALRRWASIYCELISAALISLSALVCLLQRRSSEAAGLILSSLVSFVFSLDWFIKQFADVETALLSVERLHQYAVDLDAEASDEGRLKPDDSWPQHGCVTFRNLSLTYRSGTKPVIENFCLSIAAGERVGIVGRTGAGKSSLLTALMRAVEWSDGSVVIDGINIGEISLRDLRSRVTIVPQEPVLFAGTLRFNLDPPGLHSDQELWTALEKVGLKGIVAHLQDQLEYSVRDLGENFSIGQRQLFCLARAILRRSKIVLMDEATASMDVETDAMIQHSMREDFRGCTIITIAHRLGTIRGYDRIVILDAGKIVEVGPPDDLLRDSSSRLFVMFNSGLKTTS
jgi:ABC-type multidrug transport system fused ATPase/permease subunit